MDDMGWLCQQKNWVLLRHSQRWKGQTGKFIKLCVGIIAITWLIIDMADMEESATNDENIQMFCAVTGVDANTAEHVLEAHNWCGG